MRANKFFCVHGDFECFQHSSSNPYTPRNAMIKRPQAIGFISLTVILICATILGARGQSGPAAAARTQAEKTNVKGREAKEARKADQPPRRTATRAGNTSPDAKKARRADEPPGEGECDPEDPAHKDKLRLIGPEFNLP